MEQTAAGQTDTQRGGARQQLLASLREHKALAAVTAAYVGVCYLLRLVYGYEVLRPIERSTVVIWWTYLLIALAFPVAYHLIRFNVRYYRTGRGEPAGRRARLAESWEAYRREHFSVHRLGGVLVACTLLAIVMSTFMAYKRAIPLFNPFSWDPAFMRLDRALHLGRDPWIWLQPIFGNVAGTWAIDKIYILWLRTIPLVLAWQFWSANRGLRKQFLLSFAVSSIVVGTVLATLLSSGGPCFYAQIVGLPDPFAPLLAFLAEINESVPVAALHVQELLWDGYQGHHRFYGISAMPSMHVALPTLYVLVGFRTNRWLGWAFLAYLVAILIGSVHLAWHYAIDGYVSVAVVLVVWMAVGRWIRRKDPAPAA